jgi:hypothetical protein
MQLLIAKIAVAHLLPIIIVPVMACIPQAIAVSIRRDRFLARLFSERRDLWDALGGPRGWRWAPPRGTQPPLNKWIHHMDYFSRNEPAWLDLAPEFLDEYRAVRAAMRRWAFILIPAVLGFATLCIILIALAD